MDIQLMVFAAPLFVVLIGIESLFDYFRKTRRYQFNDTINNFSSGIFEEIASLPLRALILLPYYYLYEHYSFFTINANSMLSWIILWLLVDFLYYWYHRSSHRLTLLWIGHSVHHQSELFNLSVALRQGYFQTISSWVFYLPLALIGFPTWMFVIVVTVNTIYQFWIHTESIRKMGWFEYVFNTPSHHRVHHGKNPEYIDKNYAGSLIVWDKLFGTFEPETIPVDYGVTEPLDSWNPFYANIKVIKDVLYYGQKLKSKWSLLKAFIKPPEWINHRLKDENQATEKRVVKEKNHNSPKMYLFVNTVIAIILYSCLSLVFDPDKTVSWLLGALILLTLYNLGHLADSNKSMLLAELVRTVLLVFGLHCLQTEWLMPSSIGVLFFIMNYLLIRFSKFNRKANSLIAA